MIDDLPLLAVSLGDPNGIGPEVLLKAALDDRVRESARLLAVGPLHILEDQAAALGLGRVLRVDAPDRIAEADALAVWEPATNRVATYQWGVESAEGGRIAMQAVSEACRLCQEGIASGMVTAPLSKASIQRAGYEFPGHTEYLQSITGAKSVVMVLAASLPAGDLRVALVTIHVPVAEVRSLISAARIETVCRDLEGALRTDFGISQPKLALLGLNPHAGEGGIIGTEEISEIIPAREALLADGVSVAGPFPADGFFGRAAWREFDVVIAMYHDQGLAPFKALAMGAGVNISLGLPIVRTSPDHGTAFGIAGHNVADAESMVEAILVAANIAQRRSASGNLSDSLRRGTH